MVKIKKLRTNYELRFPYNKRLQDYIKSIPNDQQKTKMDVLQNPDGSTFQDWYRVVNEAGLIKIISFMKDNHEQFSFDNLSEEDLNHLRNIYKEKNPKRTTETVNSKTDGLDIGSVDWSFMKIQPYDYQKQAVLFFEKANGNAILADQPGLGKSNSALTYAVKNNYKALVVCPASLKLNWRNEIQKFSNEKAFIFKYKPKKKSGEIIVTKEESLFHIINYESLETYIELKFSHKCSFVDCGWEEINTKRKYKECPKCLRINSIKSRQNGLDFISDKEGIELIPKDYNLIILDESHYIKSNKTLRFLVVKKALSTIPKKLLLSGTAIKNRPIEFFTSLNLIDPQEFKNMHMFGLRYCAGYQNDFNGWDYSGASNLEELYQRISPYFIRRLKKDVLSYLPPKTYTNIPIELSNEEYREYKKIEKGIVDESEETDNEANYLARFQKLKQFTSHIKTERAIELIQNIIDSDEKIVIFTEYIAVVEKLYKHFEKYAVAFTGQHNMVDKQAAVDKFMNDNNCKVFIGTIGAAGVGITLTSASVSLFISSPFSPADKEQAEDRIHRITSTADKIQIITLVCNDTLDEDIEKMLIEKHEIVSKVLDGKVIDKKIDKIEGSIIKDLIKVILNKKNND